jgi:thioesterase domain-containing protein
MYPDMTSGQLKRILNIYQSHTRALSRYRCRHSISAPIILFRAEEVLSGQGGCEGAQGGDWGWGRCTEGDVFVESVPGNHVSMMNEPHVKALAQKLLGHLKP